MATKPLDSLSPAYRRRIERALAQGKSRQAARGHKPKEHIQRREREIEEFGLSGSQVNSIRNFYARWNMFGTKFEPDEEELIEKYKELGYESFKQYRGIWDWARRRYLRELAAGTHRKPKGEGDMGEEGPDGYGLAYLYWLTEEANGPPREQWLYYH